MTLDIQWYPGHMAKARRQMAEQLGAVDMVIEVVDARIPAASRNPDFDQLFGTKARLLVLNKADLADPAVTRAWQRAMAEKGIGAMESNAKSGRERKAILAALEAAARPQVQAMLEKKGVRKTVRALIAGIPNVGKSALINCLSGSASARTGDRPGVTRGQQLIRVSPYLELLDTPGVLWPKLEIQSHALHLAFTGAVKDEIMDGYNLSLALLAELRQKAPQALEKRWPIVWGDNDGENLLAICRLRGLMQKGGVPDEERAAALVLREFRDGKLGRITLEAPDDEP